MLSSQSLAETLKCFIEQTYAVVLDKALFSLFEWLSFYQKLVGNRNVLILLKNFMFLYSFSWSVSFLLLFAKQKIYVQKCTQMFTSNDSSVSIVSQDIYHGFIVLQAITCL